MTTDLHAPPATVAPRARPASRRRTDADSVGIDTPRRIDVAAWTFAGAMAAATWFWWDRAQGSWFPATDEWWVITSRGFDLDGLLETHRGHLIALPVAAYRFLYWAFGLRTYAPYVATTIGLHLATAVLIRTVMRRSTVGPWMSTLCASVFLFFGAAEHNVVNAFQMTLAGSVVFGLVQVVLADHDHRSPLRDAAAVLAGIAAVASSGVGPFLVGATGVSSLLRRGWRAALVQVVPPAAVVVAWSMSGWSKERPATTNNPYAIARWSVTGLSGTFLEMGRSEVVAVLLGALCVLGFGVAARAYVRRRRASKIHAPIGLAVAAVAFSCLTVSKSALGFTYASSSRYIGIIGALLLPMIALGAQALVRRKDLWFIPIAVLLLITIVGGTNAPWAGQRVNLSDLQFVFPNMIRQDLAAGVPDDHQPVPTRAPWITVGWLRDTLESGRMPESGNIGPRAKASNRLRLLIRQTNMSGVPKPDAVARRLAIEAGGEARVFCAAVSAPRTVVLRPGQYLVFRGSVFVSLLPPSSAVPSVPVVYGRSFLTGYGPHVLEAVSRTVRLRVSQGSKDALACSIVPAVEPANTKAVPGPDSPGPDSDASASEPEGNGSSLPATPSGP